MNPAPPPIPAPAVQPKTGGVSPWWLAGGCALLFATSLALPALKWDDGAAWLGAEDGNIFDHELNQRSIVIRDGHIVALCLRKTPFSGTPDFAGFAALEALDGTTVTGVRFKVSGS